MPPELYGETGVIRRKSPLDLLNEVRARAGLPPAAPAIGYERPAADPLTGESPGLQPWPVGGTPIPQPQEDMTSAPEPVASQERGVLQPPRVVRAEAVPMASDVEVGRFEWKGHSLIFNEQELAALHQLLNRVAVRQLNDEVKRLGGKKRGRARISSV